MLMLMIKFHTAVFTLFMCSFETPSSALVAYHLERGGMALHNAVGIICYKGATIEYQGAGTWYMD